MGRQRMSLTRLDMDNLVELVEDTPISVSAAAELLDVERAYVYRLIKRVNELIGTPNLGAWRQGSRFVIPPEVRRLAKGIHKMDEAFYEASLFPRISAGFMSSILLRQVLRSSDVDWHRIRILRSRDIRTALREYEIDLAIIHEGSFDEEENHFGSKRLLKWKAVIVSPPHTPSDELNHGSAIRWQPNSYSEKIANQVRKFTAWYRRLEPGPYADSNLAALEMVRRNVPVHAVLPTIYLRKQDWKQLHTVFPESEVADYLIGVYRLEDQMRIEKFIDSANWAKLTEGNIHLSSAINIHLSRG